MLVLVVVSGGDLTADSGQSTLSGGGEKTKKIAKRKDAKFRNQRKQPKENKCLRGLAFPFPPHTATKARISSQRESEDTQRESKWEKEKMETRNTLIHTPFSLSLLLDLPPSLSSLLSPLSLHKEEMHQSMLKRKGGKGTRSQKERKKSFKKSKPDPSFFSSSPAPSRRFQPVINNLHSLLCSETHTLSLCRRVT